MIGFLRKTTVHQEYIKNSGFYSGILLPLSRNNEIAHPMKKPKEKETGKATGMDNSTPSRSEYFSWINNTNEGSTEAQTLINLEFFKWLRDEYGMQLDIYAFDAGNINGPGFYGSNQSFKFHQQFPNNFGPICRWTHSCKVKR
jgi:hypothetical protein